MLYYISYILLLRKSSETSNGDEELDVHGIGDVGPSLDASAGGCM